jgi:4-nitrophenyl phosphatase
LTHVTLDEIVSCGSAAASYLKETVLPSLPENQRGVYMIGQEALELELKEQGLSWTGGTDPEDDVLLPPQDFSSITPDPSIGVVLYGFQSRPSIISLFWVCVR